MSSIHFLYPPDSSNAAKREQPRGLVFDLLPMLRGWLARANQRASLDALDDYLLRDIGKTRAEVATEISKPFWRP